MQLRSVPYMTKIAPADRPKTLYKYSVSGVGEFPADMLRYDCCWPESESDAGLMGTGQYGDRSQRRVNLASYFPATDGRWESFGWKVSRL